MGTGHEMNRPDCYEAIAKEDERLADEYEKQASACRASAAEHRKNAEQLRSAKIKENLSRARELLGVMDKDVVDFLTLAVRLKMLKLK